MSHSITGYGVRFEKPVGAAVARAIAQGLGAVYPPASGYEITVAEDTRSYPIAGERGKFAPWTSKLILRNVSGSYVLCSTDTERKDWADYFGVDTNKHGTAMLSVWLQRRKAVTNG